tara:strand:+ start:747 stop:1142 length:396 start_codon:yes stop_codon:yes gene_type:complete
MVIRVEDLEDGQTITSEQFRALVDGEEVPVDKPAPSKPRNHPERDLQRNVQELARAYGWTDWHVLRSKGMRAGFPDLVLIRPPDLVWVELKSEKGRLSPAQKEMHEMLRACGQQVYLWYPGNEEEIMEVLR